MPTVHSIPYRPLQELKAARFRRYRLHSICQRVTREYAPTTGCSTSLSSPFLLYTIAGKSLFRVSHFLLTSLSIMHRKLGSYSLPNRLQWNGGISAESTVYHRAILKQKLWNTRLRICSITGSIKFQPADLLRLMSLKG